MKTAAERLQFVIRFAQMDLDTLRPGDWLNLLDDLMAFLGMGAEGFSLTEAGEIMWRVIEPPHPDIFPEFAFRELQAEIDGILQALLDDRRSEHAGRETPVTRICTAYVIHSADAGAPRPGSNVLTILGATRDVCLHILLHLLSQERTHQILRCP